ERRHRGAVVAPWSLPRAQLGAAVPRRRRVARLLAAQADLPRRLARPPGEARRARGRVGRQRRRVRLPASRGWAPAARARAGAVVARPAVQAIAGAAYLAALLALDRFASYPEQLALGALTWCVLFGALCLAPLERRAQALGVV